MKVILHYQHNHDYWMKGEDGRPVVHSSDYDSGD